MNGAASETPLCVRVRTKRLVVLYKRNVMVYEGLWCRYCARKTVYEEAGIALRGFVGKMILYLTALDFELHLLVVILWLMLRAKSS